MCIILDGTVIDATRRHLTFGCCSGANTRVLLLGVLCIKAGLYLHAVTRASLIETREHFYKKPKNLLLNSTIGDENNKHSQLCKNGSSGNVGWKT